MKGDPYRIRAYSAVWRAVRDGRLPRVETLQCVRDGRPGSVYHHYLGYEPDHYLAVEPWCRSCHAIEHGVGRYFRSEETKAKARVTMQADEFRSRRREQERIRTLGVETRKSTRSRTSQQTQPNSEETTVTATVTEVEQPTQPDQPTQPEPAANAAEPKKRGGGPWAPEKR